MGWPVGWTKLEPLPTPYDWHWSVEDDWWDSEDDIPRLAPKTPDTKDRLKAIGNGWVPLCGAWAWRLLSKGFG
jgi:hypothetical protein